MDEIAIDMIELESLTTRLEGGVDPLRKMIVIPELRGDEHILPLSRPRLKHLLHRIADRLFIAIALRAIEVTKPHFQCGLGCLFGREGIRNRRPNPEAGIAPDPRVRGSLHSGACRALSCLYSSVVR